MPAILLLSPFDDLLPFATASSPEPLFEFLPLPAVLLLPYFCDLLPFDPADLLPFEDLPLWLFDDLLPLEPFDFLLFEPLDFGLAPTGGRICLALDTDLEGCVQRRHRPARTSSGCKMPTSIT